MLRKSEEGDTAPNGFPVRVSAFLPRNSHRRQRLEPLNLARLDVPMVYVVGELISSCQCRNPENGLIALLSVCCKSFHLIGPPLQMETHSIGVLFTVYCTTVKSALPELCSPTRFSPIELRRLFSTSEPPPSTFDPVLGPLSQTPPVHL